MCHGTSYKSDTYEDSAYLSNCASRNALDMYDSNLVVADGT